MSLQGKTVVVVGGSSGIGYATAEMAKAKGADVVIASRAGARLDAAAKALGVQAIAADVTSDEAIESLFRKTGPVDHVVLTAAQLKAGPFKTQPIAEAKATMEGKFWGAWRVARAAEARKAMLDKIAASLPVGRVGLAEDVAKQILAFMDNGFATGAIVYLDGGGTIA
jgi:NAD(P)-dependent dehydrogenase (short-subunit alcohol dehydrogenase family)